MSENHQRPTVASDIALPVEIVELERLKTKAGEPVRIQCEAVDEMIATEPYGLPGARVPVEDSQRVSKRDRIAETLAKAPPIIHAGTVLINADGSEIRPAFHCDEAHAVPGSIPWRLVCVPDKLKVVYSIMSLSGYGGAAEHRFSGGDGGGAVHGVGAVAGGEGDAEVTTPGAS